MTEFNHLPPAKEKRKRKSKRGQWVIVWLALGLAISVGLVYLNAPRVMDAPQPTPTMEPLVVSMNAPVDAPLSASSVTAWGERIAQVTWEGSALRWRVFELDEGEDWEAEGGGSFLMAAPIVRADISADGAWLLVTVAHDDQSRTHLMRTDGKLSTWWVESNAAAFQPNSTEAIIDQINGHLAYYALRENAIINTTLPSNVPRVQALALQGRRLVVLGSDVIVRYDNLTDPTTITRARLITDELPDALALLPDGRAAVLTLSEVVVYDFQGGYQRYALPESALQRANALIASGASPRLAVLHTDGVTIIRLDDGSPLTPEANQAAVTFWPIEGVKSAAFVDMFDLLVVSTSSGLHLMRDGQIVTTLSDEWPMTPPEPSDR
ncbi:MAG: hypothetical protein SNJ54_17340 [Anaerolineae bacterium]